MGRGISGAGWLFTHITLSLRIPAPLEATQYSEVDHQSWGIGRAARPLYFLNVAAACASPIRGKNPIFSILMKGDEVEHLPTL